jgi:hypothetical protein
MPFVMPYIPFSFGSRDGTTGLNGSLTPTQGVFFSRVGADICAYPPLGMILTTCSWGFWAGFAPEGSTTLTVAAQGPTFEGANAWTFGGYASASAEICITIEEFVRLRTGRRGWTLEFTRSITGAATGIFDFWTAGLGYQYQLRDSFAATLCNMATVPGRIYRCWVSALQSANCQGVSGVAGASFAVSNFFFDMSPVFYAFASDTGGY